MRIGLLLTLLLVATACDGQPGSVATLEPETTAPAPTSQISTTTTSATASPTTTAPVTTTTPSTTTTTTTTLPAGTVPQDARAVVLAGLPGTSLDGTTAAFLTDGGVAVILFTKNFSTREQVGSLTSEIACAATGPVIVAVDQEPGRVARLAAIGIESPSVDSDLAAFSEAAVDMAAAMVELGINLDLAPVMDVARGSNPVLVGRNFGPDPAVVAEFGVQFIEALAGSGVGTTAKHFPGHGLSTVDPHVVVTPISASLAELEEYDFPPFRAAIDAGVGAVMVGHPIYAALDVDNPASLSPAVLSLLREEFGFEGVAMTDAFSMAGVRTGGSVSQLAVEAVAAGEDLLIVDNPTEVAPVVAAIEAAVADGSLARDRLAEAAGRVRRLAGTLAVVPCDG